MTTIERCQQRCPNDAGTPLGEYLDGHIRHVIDAHQQKLSNGQRGQFNNGTWKQKLELVRHYYSQNLADSQTYVDGKRLVPMVRSLEIAAHLAEFIVADKPAEDVRQVHVALLDEQSYEVGNLILGHVAELCVERGAQKPDYTGQVLDEFILKLEPETAYAAADFGNGRIMTASVLMTGDEPPRPVSLDLSLYDLSKTL